MHDLLNTMIKDQNHLNALDNCRHK